MPHSNQQLDPDTVVEALLDGIVNGGASKRDVVETLDALHRWEPPLPPSIWLTLLQRMSRTPTKLKVPSVKRVFVVIQRWLLDSNVLLADADYTLWQSAKQLMYLDDDAFRAAHAERVFPDLTASNDYVQQLPMRYKLAVRSWTRNNMHVLHRRDLLRHRVSLYEVFVHAPRLTQPLRVYRGVSLSGPDRLRLSSPYPLSVTPIQRAADHFTWGSPCCLLDIIVPPGTPVLNLADPRVGDLSGVDEIVLPPDGTLEPELGKLSFVYRPHERYAHGPALSTRLAVRWRQLVLGSRVE